jgi:anti-sigma regulatory factor (Ser/Thr protein kinase)
VIGRASKDPEPADLSVALTLELQRGVEAPGIARAAVSELSRELRLADRVSQTLLLLVSEVVSNAVLHSSGPRGAPITLTGSVSTEAVRITVSDAGEAFTPRQRDPASFQDGYGLYLLEKAASRWGVDPSGPTSVWFELPLATC